MSVLTLAHATSWDVVRAHCVAAVITLFWWAWSSHLLATFFAFKTKLAVAFATRLARPNKIS